jgi:hypothetical protein
MGDTLLGAGTTIFLKMPCWRAFQGGLMAGVAPYWRVTFFARAKKVTKALYLKECAPKEAFALRSLSPFDGRPAFKVKSRHIHVLIGVDTVPVSTFQA